MTEDRFDPELAERLRSYESRLPDAAPPAPGASRSGGIPRWPMIGVGALAAVAAVLLLAVLLRPGPDDNVGDPSASPVPSPSAPASAAPTGSAEPITTDDPTPGPQPSESQAEPTVDLSWTEVASFGSPDGASAVNALVQSDAGLVAVGAAYEQPLPILGPTPPHEGRVWRSMTVGQWEDVTPADTFTNVELRHLLVTSDRRLIAHGWVTTGEFGDRHWAAWESIAGEDWDELDSPFPVGTWPMSMEVGGRGYVAIVVEPAGPMMAVWWSPDGRSWERVHELGAEGGYRVGAGNEGFVVAGWRGTAQEPHTIASGDGRTWFEASTPPGVASAVAPRGDDWLAVSREPDAVSGQPSSAGAWRSADGLTWEQIGGFPLEVRRPNDGSCTESPTTLFSAGSWLIAGTVVSYPCSEGGVETQGAQRISVDGVNWTELPFAPASEEVGLGTRIGGALEIDGRLVLVGEKDRVATFWIGEQP